VSLHSQTHITICLEPQTFFQFFSQSTSITHSLTSPPATANYIYLTLKQHSQKWILAPSQKPFAWGDTWACKLMRYDMDNDTAMEKEQRDGERRIDSLDKKIQDS
jgi:hypothetical protein